MTKKWQIKKQIKDSIDGLDIHHIVEQLLLQRGLKNKDEVFDFFEPDYSKLHDPFLFKDMERVVGRVKQAIDKREIIGIFGDHDADGVSSATILSDGLEMLGLNVDVYIPDKLTEGHGINTKAIDEFYVSGVTLMFSVDCGTSNIDAVEYANKKGIDVIITDHHHAPEVLPDAYAIINPQLSSCEYPFKHLSGTAVAFKLVQALFERLLPEKKDQLKWLLDVVCVGTVADCMPLIGENRILVNYGLIVLSKTRRVGYQEMIAASPLKITSEKLISADMIAYQIAPRINAAGRMSHAKYAFELLRATDQAEAKELAKSIESQNLERRRLTDTLTRKIEKIVDTEHDDKSFILISGEDYPVGIVGIIAGRVANKYQKPAGIFTKLEGESRGSFRSVEGVHIVDVLNECSEYLEKHGGHEQAAGAIIKNENFDTFCDAANKCVKKHLNGRDTDPVLFIDCKVDILDVDHELVNQLKKLEPYGEGNEEPIFTLSDLVVQEIRAIGSGGKHLKMKLASQDGVVVYDSIAFGRGFMEEIISVGDSIDIATYIQENEWMGNVNVQFNIVDIKIL